MYIGARSAENVAATVTKLCADGLDVDGSVVDVRSRTGIRTFVQAAVDRYGPIDILVNNAGRSGGGVTADISDELWFDVIDTNLNSVFLMTREVLTAGGMVERAGADNQHRVDRRQAGRGARRPVLGVQARRGRVHQGAGQRTREDGRSP